MRFIRLCVFIIAAVAFLPLLYHLFFVVLGMAFNVLGTFAFLLGVSFLFFIAIRYLTGSHTGK